MASNRPGEMQQSATSSKTWKWPFQWPQIGRVRCNSIALTHLRCGGGFNGLKSAG